MRSLVLFALISCSAPALAPVPQGRSGGQSTFSVRTDVVVFNVIVTDDQDRHVSGLTAGEFQVREDSRVQDITLFSAEDVPASVGLIVDNSGSMLDKQAEVAKAALAFAGASNPQDEMFVVNFNEHVSVGLPPAMPFTNDVNQIHAALLRTPPAGMTALYDALAVGIQHVATGTRDRKALVVLSDGGDNASRRRLDDVLAVAQRSNATIYTIGIYDETDLDRNPAVLRKIADVSGGRAYFPESLDNLDRVWRDIAGGIRSQYTVGYSSSDAKRDGTFRKVTITASHNGRSLRVTTRAGYFAPADKGPYVAPTDLRSAARTAR